MTSTSWSTLAFAPVYINFIVKNDRCFTLTSHTCLRCRMTLLLSKHVQLPVDITQCSSEFSQQGGM